MELPLALLWGTAAALGVAALAIRYVGTPPSPPTSARQVTVAPSLSTDYREVTNARPSIPPDVPVSWGYKCFWLAIRGADTNAVVKALELKDVRPSGWDDGILAAYRDEFFVTPQVDGWVFAVSTKLPDAGGPRHPNKIAPYITRLSQLLDCEIQYFGTYRIVDYHAWMRATKGKITRGFAVVEGEVIMNEGAPTKPEVDLKLAYKDSDAYLNSERTVDEEDVMTMAGKWSINPQTFDDYGRKVGLGVLGSTNP